jgi:hypothetical protein
MVRARIYKALLCGALGAGIGSCQDPFRCFLQPEPSPSMPTSATIKVAETYQIDGSVWADCERPVSTKLNWSAFTFTTENSAIATVTIEGVVTGMSAGQTRVHIRHDGGTSTPMTVIVTASSPGASPSP